jgi:hypothetical protein
LTAFVLACGAQVLPGGQHHLPLTTENLNTEFLGRVAHQAEPMCRTPSGARHGSGCGCQAPCRRRTSAATDATSTGTVVSTVISGPMPTARSYLPIVASVAVVSQ